MVLIAWQGRADIDAVPLGRFMTSTGDMMLYLIWDVGVAVMNYGRAYAVMSTDRCTSSMIAMNRCTSIMNRIAATTDLCDD